MKQDNKQRFEVRCASTPSKYEIRCSQGHTMPGAATIGRLLDVASALPYAVHGSYLQHPPAGPFPGTVTHEA